MSSRLLPRLFAAPVLCLALASLAGCGKDTPETASDPAASGAPASTVNCDYPDDGTSQKTKDVEKPETAAPKEGEVEMTISTSAGDIGVTLDSDAAPCTVNSFRSLASQNYFDDTPCHRLVPGFVLQCGDPSGTGGGGPGYSFADELTGSETYTRGVLAMANAGPDTNGSQFFIVLADAQLPPSYTVFGSVDEADMAVVDAIAAKGTKDGVPDGPPKEPVTITSVD
jgi:peptidyl-prolyl cis-trans isomerase B (cyclophilin B)